MVPGALQLIFAGLPEPLSPFSHSRQYIAAVSVCPGRWGGWGRGAAGLPGASPWPGPHIHTGSQSARLPSPRRPSLCLCSSPAPGLQAQAQRSRCVRDPGCSPPAPTATPCGNGGGRRGPCGPPQPPSALGPDATPPRSPCSVIEHGPRNRVSVQRVATVFGPRGCDRRRRKPACPSPWCSRTSGRSSSCSRARTSSRHADPRCSRWAPGTGGGDGPAGEAGGHVAGRFLTPSASPLSTGRCEFCTPGV